MSSIGGQTTASTTKTDTHRSAGVQVTTKVESTGVVDKIDLDPTYFKTVPGIIKIVQLLLAIICMACASPVVTRYTHFFMFVVATYFVITFLLCIVYFFTLKTLLPRWPWLVIELAVTAAGVVLYFIVSVVQLAASNRRNYHFALSILSYYGSYIAAGSFGLFNFVAYTVGAFLLFVEWKQSRINTATAATSS